MNKYFITKVSYVKTMDNGLQKKVTEPYLVEAMSYTEAEATIIEQIKPYVQGDFSVSDIKNSRIYDVFINPNDEKYYKVNIAFISLDERTGKEKMTKSRMIVTADNFPKAVLNFEDAMKSTMANFVILSIEETPIIDYFPYNDKL